MATLMGIDNAIGWAHWRLRGGWKNLLITASAFSAIVVGLIMFTLHVNPNNAAGALYGWRVALLLIQGGILVFFGATRVSAAMRSDAANRMLESHRLMPVSPLAAISGYLWGPTAQSALFSIVVFVIGLVVTVQARIDPRTWIGANVLIAGFAVFSWVVAAFVASLSKGAGIILGITMALSAITAGNGAVLVPAASILTSPLIGRSVFSLGMANATLAWPLIFSWFAQVYIGSILYCGAARRYRCPEDTALAVVPAIFLLAGWVLMSAIAINHADVYFGIFRMDVRNWQHMFYTAIIGCMLLSLVAVANAARDPRIAVISPLIALMCAAIVSLLVLYRAMPDGPFNTRNVQTLAVVAAFSVAICYLLRIVYRVTKRGAVIALGWILLTWLTPILIDMASWAMQQSYDEFTLTPISSFSTVGAIIMIWEPDMPDIGFAIVAHWAVAIAMVLLFHATSGLRKPVPIST